MAPQVARDVSVYRGDTLVKKFRIITKTTQAPVDVTTYGDTWTSKFKHREDDTEGFAASVDLSDGADGYISIRLESDQTAVLPSKGVWDIQAVDTTTTPHYVRTIVKGTFSLVKDVS